MTAALLALVLLPAVVGALLAAAGPRADRVAAGTAVGASAVTTALAGMVAVGRPDADWPFMAGARLGLAVDGLAAVFAPTVAAVTMLVLVFAAGDPPHADGRRAPARFHGLMLIFAAAALATVVAATLPTLLLAWEVMGATSYALIGFDWRSARHAGSGLTAFLTTRGADLGLYVAAGAALAGGAGMALADLEQADPGWRHVVAAGVAVAALGKAAQLPFSFWLSRAMDGPSPVSALLHSAAMVALGGYLLLRTAPLLAATGWAGTTVAWVGAATAVLLGAVAVVQSDLKQLLAASTAAQLGFVVMAAGVGASTGGAAHLVAHASVKASLFLAAGAWLAALGTKQLPRLVGAARTWPVVGLAATAGLLSLAGLPPLALWATKDAVLAGAADGHPGLYAAGLLATVLSACYAGRALVLLWRAERAPVEQTRPAAAAAGQEGTQGTGSIGFLMQLPLVPLAVGAAVLGLLVLPPLDGRLREVVGGPEAPHPTPTELVVSGVLVALALAATAVVVLRRAGPTPGRAVGWLLGWLSLERLAHVAVVRPVLWLAAAAAAVDDRVLDRTVHSVARAVPLLAATADLADRRGVDGAVDGVARGVPLVAGGAERGDRRGIDGAVRAVAREVRALGDLARRPQTGMLHHYYLQVVAVLAVALVVLVVVR